MTSNQAIGATFAILAILVIVCLIGLIMTEEDI